MNRLAARVTAVLLFWMSVAAAGSPEMQRAVLELVVNGAARGEAFVLLRGDDVLVPQTSLVSAGLVRLNAPTETHEGVEHVSLRAAALPFQYDERALTLTIIAPPAVLARTVVDLSTRARDDLRYDSSPSLFVNYAPRLVDGRQFQAFAEAGLSLGSLLMESSATYDPERGPTRLLSRATYDDRPHLRSATLGDTFVSAGPLGGALTLGGLSLARNYELDPYLVKIPRLGYAGNTLSPSTVDVYVNDVLVRRVAVDPGEFQLANITPLGGAGTTRYVLKDAYGQEQRLESAYYSSGGVLAAGLSEFAYGIGLVRKDFGTKSFSYGEPAVIARHRFGLSDHVTPGLHLEFKSSLLSAGADLTLAGDFGELELHAAGSLGLGHTARPGMAGIMGYSYRSGGTSLRTVLRGTSDHFATLSLDPDQYRSLVEEVTTTSYALSSTSTLSSDIALAMARARPPLARFALRLTARLSRTLGLEVRTSRSQRELGLWEHDIFTTLAWSMPAEHFAQVSEHTGPDGSDVTARLSRALPGQTGVGYQLSGALGAVTRAAGAVQAQTSFGRLGGSYTYQAGTHSTLLEGSGGVVLLGGKAYFTRPVSQSFAVLKVPGVPNVRGYLNNREMGTTDSSGELFVPDLASYQSNLLRINQADLPLDYQLDAEEVALAPPTRGGAVIEFAVRRVRISRGRIVRDSLRHGRAVKYGTVSVRTSHGVVSSLLGSNGEFELDGLAEGRFTGMVESEEGDCQISLHIPASDEPVQYVGTVPCRPIEAAPPGAAP